MTDIVNFLLGPFLVWLPKIFFWVVFLLAAFSYFSHKSSVINYKLLVISSVVFRIFYAALLTLGQYYVWSQDKFTQTFINFELNNLPINPLFKNYFAFYSYSRFWLNVIIAVGVAFLFYLFLKYLQKRNERFFEEGETELGFLAALIVGWPNFVVFLPLVFLSVVIVSIIRRLFLKEAYTTLGAPFLISVFMVLLWGGWLLRVSGLSVLKL